MEGTEREGTTNQTNLTNPRIGSDRSGSRGSGWDSLFMTTWPWLTRCSPPHRQLRPWRWLGIVRGRRFGRPSDFEKAPVLCCIGARGRISYRMSPCEARARERCRSECGILGSRERGVSIMTSSRTSNVAGSTAGKRPLATRVPHRRGGGRRVPLHRARPRPGEKRPRCGE